jgi:hypothetical protein
MMIYPDVLMISISVPNDAVLPVEGRSLMAAVTEYNCRV